MNLIFLFPSLFSLKFHNSSQQHYPWGFPLRFWVLNELRKQKRKFWVFFLHLHHVCVMKIWLWNVRLMSAPVWDLGSFHVLITFIFVMSVWIANYAVTCLYCLATSCSTELFDRKRTNQELWIGKALSFVVKLARVQRNLDSLVHGLFSLSLSG